LISSGHWIRVQRNTSDVIAGTRQVTQHFETLNEAWRTATAIDCGHVLSGPPTIPIAEQRREIATSTFIFSRCPAPGDEECPNCWLAEVPF
jgi:hypothetical protein